jgi:cytochrome c553
MRTLPRAVLLMTFALSLAAPRRAVAQMNALPDTFTNLKVLPKNITKAELVATMRDFAMGLGVRCTHCHVGEEGKPLSTYKFAADDKVTKKKARVMLQMVTDINGKELADLPERSKPAISVRCITCHRGLAKPVLLQDLLADTAAARGTPAAIAKYQGLKKQYFGSGSYDFREGTLSQLAGRLDAQKLVDDAIEFAKLNASEHPESDRVQLQLGDLLREKGDKLAAGDAYRKALELNPKNQEATRRLGELGS